MLYVKSNCYCLSVVKRLVVLVAIFALSVILLSPDVSHSFDFVKKIISPEKYWEEQVSEAEREVDLYRKEIYSCRLEIDKLKQIRVIVIRQNILGGMSPQEAVDDFQVDMEASIVTFNFFSKMYEDSVTDLQKAKAKLQEVRKEK